MRELKHFLETNTLYGKSILAVIAAVSVVGPVAMAVFLIPNGALFDIVFVSIPFLLMGAFCCWVLKKSILDFPKWWNSLTEAQQEDCLHDFANARQESHLLKLGERYAYIRHIGQPIAYEDISDISFRHSRNSSTLFVLLRDGRKMATGVPAFTDQAALTVALLQHSCNQ